MIMLFVIGGNAVEILKERYTITELSERLNVTDHALRYYEKEFHLAIPKDARGRRYYTTDLANTMYQIVKMRSEGLEIKAIKKILTSENHMPDPPPVVQEDSSVSMLPLYSSESSNQLKTFFDEFQHQLTTSVSAEVISAKEQLSREMYKTKLELGACVENSVRRLESKMERHFQEVDRSLGNWRERNNKNFLRKFINKVF